MPDSTYNIDLRDIRFVLFEYLSFEKLAELEAFARVDRESVEMVLDECYKFHREVIAPINMPGDRTGCQYVDGKVVLPEGFAEAYQQFVDNSWPLLNTPEESGGMGLPYVVSVATGEMTVGANCSFALNIGLTAAAGSLLEAFGDDWMKELYLPKLQSAEWQGTMCLTEPQAGTAVGDVRTTATKKGDYYQISGTKIFITGGDHQMTPNHVHLVLARPDGAPAGAKGLSLFIVPKLRQNKAGEFVEPNDVVCAGIEHKLGIKASPTCVMQYGDSGDCRGWIIGDEGQGLPQMFHMMNHARIGVGMQGLALAAQAYLYARDYAEERVQGVDIEDMRDANAPRVKINQHPDVRRMLLWCKAVVEGSRALIYKAALYADIATGESEEAQTCRGLVELLTPICKAWVTDRAFEVTALAMQCMGGYGYIAEYPVEQHLRDVKIASIYEGTNGVQALDLLGRKLPAQKGRLFQSLLKQLDDFASNQRGHLALGDDIEFFAEQLDEYKQVTMDLAAVGMGGDRRYPVLNATSYLEMAGNTLVAWMLLEQAVIAHDKLQTVYIDRNALDEKARHDLNHSDAEASFYFNKIETARFFIYNVLVGNKGIAAQIRSDDRSALKWVPSV